MAKFGVLPASIPDYLALIGDAADGYSGIPGCGAKSTTAVLSRYRHIEHIPKDPRQWHVSVAASTTLFFSLKEKYELALLFRDLATLRTDIAVFESVDQLFWKGPTPAFAQIRPRLDATVGQVNNRKAMGER